MNDEPDPQMYRTPEKQYEDTMFSAEEIRNAIGPKPSAYVDTANQIGQLLVVKNDAYGHSFRDSGKVMNLLYPNGINADQMADALCLVRMVDKMFRIANNKDALGESPYRDLAGYAILGASHCAKPNPVVPETPAGS